MGEQAFSNTGPVRQKHFSIQTSFEDLSIYSVQHPFIHITLQTFCKWTINHLYYYASALTITKPQQIQHFQQSV